MLIGSARHWRNAALVVIVLAALLRLLYGAWVELIPEETYYWNYSRHLDIGYLDHPPMVAWLIHCGTTLFGATQFGVRAGALCCGAVVGTCIFTLTRDLFGAPCAWVALLLAQVLPFFFLAGVLMTPDAPLTAAWSASLYFLHRALQGGRSAAWIMAGLTIGVGLVSKYTIGLLVVATFVFMLVDPTSRLWFRRKEPYAAALLALVVFAPVLVWNAQHDWASFAFQTARRLAEAPRFSLQRLVGAVLVLLTPTGAFAAGAALLAISTSSPRGVRYLKIALLVPLSVFALFSLRHDVKLDWMGAPLTAALPLLALGVVQARDRVAGSLAWLRVVWPPTIIALLLVFGTGWWYLVFGIPGLGYSRHIELVPVAWHEFARQIDAMIEARPAVQRRRLLIVGMDRYAIASELAFYAPDQAAAVANTSSAHLFGDMGLMYERWFPIAGQAGRPLLLVAWEPDDLSDARLGRRAVGAEPIREGQLTRDGAMVTHYYTRFVDKYEYP